MSNTLFLYASCFPILNTMPLEGLVYKAVVKSTCFQHNVTAFFYFAADILFNVQFKSAKFHTLIFFRKHPNPEIINLELIMQRGPLLPV